MFDIGFTEILVIAVVALFVIGPERLPQTVKDISLWIGRLKRSLRDTRRELEQQIGADDIRRTLHNENVLQQLHNIKRDVNDTLNQRINIDDESNSSHSGTSTVDSFSSSTNSEEAGKHLTDEPEEDTDGSPVKTSEVATPNITADNLVSGEMPFPTAAERASQSGEKSASDTNESTDQSEHANEPQPANSEDSGKSANHSA